MSVIPLIPIDLDKPRLLRYDINAIIAAETAMGRKFLESIQDLSMADLRALLWAGLKHEEPSLTIEAVGSMLGVGDLSTITPLMMKAWGVAMPKPSENGVETPAVPLAKPRAHRG